MAEEEKKDTVEETQAAPAPQVVPFRADPDLDFVTEVTAWGGGDLKACYQCATCAVVCPLSPDQNPFPRKEIIWAQWGLKERLVNDPDLWLCHRCNDCSENCPRGAKTGDVMAALRSYAYQANAWPGFLGKILNRPALLPVALAIPVVIIYGIIMAGGNLAAPGGENVELSSMYWGQMIEPWPWLDLGFMAAAAFALFSFGVSIKRLWRGFNESGVQEDVTPKMTMVQALTATVTDIVLHRRFNDCGAAHARKWVHLLILFGFVGLAVTTGLVFVGMYVFGLQTPMPLDHPFKILGNVSAVTITVGLIIAIGRRLTPALSVDNGRNAYQDVLFLGALTVVVATGIFSEVFRLATAHGLAAGAYFLHLVFILFLFMYAPFSKFAHVIYHTTAVTWAHHVGRELKTLALDDNLPQVEKKGEAA